jgi:hypothetical protein
MKEFSPYNSRRYGKPWIAKVTTWNIGQHPTLEFGATIGTLLVEIDANPGDVVRWGQKDYRGNNTEANWGIVQNDSSVTEVDVNVAREHWLKR